MKNSVSLAQLQELGSTKVSNLPIDQLAMLLEEMTELKAKCRLYDNLLHSALVDRFAKLAAEARAKDGKDTGRVRLDIDEHIVIADLPKDVEWDQTKITSAIETIRSWNEPVEDYVSIKYSVSETKYNAWPETIRNLFAASRTVGTGKPTFKIERADK